MAQRSVIWHAVAWLAMACAAAAAQAHDGTHGRVPGSSGSAGVSSQTPPKRWDFTLPTLDGTRFVQAAGITGPVLVNFWGIDCPPCVAELPRLQAFARNNPHWTVLLVATDLPSDAAAFLQQRGISLLSLRRGANVAGLMRAAGNRQGALPFTVSVREGNVCRTELGEVSEQQLAAIAADCTPAQR